jgi:hypothetical protein
MKLVWSQERNVSVEPEIATDAIVSGCQTPMMTRKQLLHFPALNSQQQMMLALENVDLLRQNGFEIGVDEDLVADSHRHQLLSVPVSKSTVFDNKGELLCDL